MRGARCRFDQCAKIKTLNAAMGVPHAADAADT
jgi:hypothetical protein